MTKFEVGSGSFIWRHGPLVSSPPEKCIKHKIRVDEASDPSSEVFEKAVFLLENKKYLYIMYNGILENEKTGVTDYEEFDTLEKALEVYGN